MADLKDLYTLRDKMDNVKKALKDLDVEMIECEKEKAELRELNRTLMEEINSLKDTKLG